MATALPVELLTTADVLRDRLARSEDALVVLHDRAGAEALYAWLDELAALEQELSAAGGDLRAEQVRWEGLQQRVQRRAPLVLRAWGDAGTLARARAAQPRSAAAWWWRLDELAAQQRRRRLRRIITVTAGALVLLLVLLWALPRLLPVNPTARAVYRLQLQAAQHLADGDAPAAYDAMRRAVALDPANTEVLTLYGVLAEQQGDAAIAEAAWAQARSLLPGEAVFLAARGAARLQAGLLVPALDDLRAAQALDPAAPRPALLLGQALEASGDLRAALDAYGQASTLAEAADDEELAVAARMALAQLLPRVAIETAPITQP